MNVSARASINKKNNNLAKFLVGAIALLFFIGILNIFSSVIKNSVYAVSSPLQKTFWTAGESSSAFLSSLINAGNLSNENKDLKNANQKLQAQVALLQSVINGNQAQSDISLASQNDSFSLLLVGVMGLDGQDILSINKGSANGIKENMPVINQQGALFGKVFKVYKNFAQVMLISNKNSIINVKVQKPAAYAESSDEPKEISGILKGQGKPVAVLDLVPIDDAISPGDALVTSALEGIFPKDLLVGTITKVEKNDQNPHQQAQVQPFLNSSTDNLFVITNYKR
ncbi:MAG: hypothetical protein A2528_01700 [Candidatus Staskawiczbacteria bacterium RIFOXYD2_FULL_37_9]|uniref:Cell shape-determining protein MreC n=1 Tax=Candidatus Staskawiczbacteria bacterium RIFOXYB1_FULL_37_44 TaxID=1802223 RepID=A0A1G2IUV7_9BACT|nr:MAG: hypothetical protein A2358_03140 [Candidatus Staskawiczbacteria bacterium RIFOXYB1_FULL_37_44]OGZ83600.1 MAG: hypothetical protein A2416_04605 [Candidatus Staskawiczbacteria bacterium RIFOXYC1_FULL_37_52]OGZ89039.1 MAG: hypothetical protein A2444_00205 [Candidatus Staskawiczbacteria bacterium RIFOXYC2_FULL_37_19]OGZ93009.1 MAG: hypothetical protein A2528_01700 [Candidatus Staskawiczbacteria bacterium RIFOXYD2_FULL_37_9]